MRRKPIETCDFDPFAYNYIYRNWSDVKSRMILIAAPVMALALIVATQIDGRLGAWADFQLGADIRRLWGKQTEIAARPDFPLTRDVASWILGLSIVVGAYLLHWQWKYMRTCLSQLIANGVLLVPERDIATIGSLSEEPVTPAQRAQRLFEKLAKIVRRRVIKWINEQRATVAADGLVVKRDQYLKLVVERVTRSLTRRMRFITLVCLVAAGILAYLITLAAERSLFVAFAPDSLTDAEKVQWQAQAYSSWWASTGHPVGHGLFLLLATLTIFMILSLNVTGAAAVYITLAMRHVVTADVDWLNRDGRFGWMPLAKVFRTVYWALASSGLALFTVLFVVGFENYMWISPLILLYMIVVPTYTLVPGRIFRGVADVARERRIKEIVFEYRRQGIDLHKSAAAMGAAAVEIERCRRAQIQPMRLRSLLFATTVLPILLPIVLTIGSVLIEAIVLVK